MDRMREGGLVVGEGGGRRRMQSSRERENNRRRERRRRAITANIYYCLRAQGNYNLHKNCDNNEVLKALCKEAGWVVLPDGTTFPKGSRTPLPTIEGGTSTTTTPCSSQRPSPMPSSRCSPSWSSFPSPSQCSPFSSSFPSPSTLDMKGNPLAYLSNCIPSSLPALGISNSAPVTPPDSSPSSRFPKPNNFKWESLTKQSFYLPFLTSSAPTSPTRFTQATIPECDKSDCQWFKNYEPMVTCPNSPTFNLVEPMAALVATKDIGSEDGEVQAWEGERIHGLGLDDLELTLGRGIAKK